MIERSDGTGPVHARRLPLAVLLLTLGCLSSDRRGFVTASEIPDDSPYLGSRHASWISDGRLFVEVEQVAGLNVAEIECDVRGEDLHLEPVRVSSGGSGTATFEIALPSSRSSEFWSQHMFWVTRRTYTPLWIGRPREPSERVPVSPAMSPPQIGSGARTTSTCR